MGWIVLIIYGVLCVVALPGIAACMLSSKISQEEEKRDGYRNTVVVQHCQNGGDREWASARKIKTMKGR